MYTRKLQANFYHLHKGPARVAAESSVFVAGRCDQVAQDFTYLGPYACPSSLSSTYFGSFGVTP